MRFQIHEAKVGSRNRICIPKPVRDYLELLPGDQVVWSITEDGLVWLSRGGDDHALDKKVVLVSQIHK